MKKTPIDQQLVDQNIAKLKIDHIGQASIREIVALVNLIEEGGSDKFVRMEMGVPGLPPAAVGTKAEIEALESGVASKYPMMDGIKPLKQEAARFVKSFMNVDVDPAGCIPTVGSMQGTYAALLVASNVHPEKDTALFIDPGFPVQKQQMLVMGHKYETFDVFNYRGAKLREKLESILAKGNINSLIYSNPNNPSWICFTEEELQTIGELADKYDVIVMEDLAYFAMDFRKDLYTPGKPPYQSTVARYTDNYILFISSSKIFSYAGQRCGIMVISDALYQREYENLKVRFQSNTFGNTITLRVLYALSSGTSHSAQFALAAMFKAASDGQFNFVEDVKEYGDKARIMKELFQEYGFYIVYGKDGNELIGDGFYFTIGYPKMTGEELLGNLLYYGISAITLKNTGSEKEGLRACVSHVNRSQFDDLETRLKQFAKDFPVD
ncbi:aminotransferase class I/II-fold pyridoxal phosphate-dependent enzyme [Sunxiuqinia elliptica]|uniref:Aspartate/methionine/tyrosine aminotransferase n=1 Tax=Sunxiuqinia elliptica TaxID=655355 RepID=A0A4R6GMA4_9BACT|nr:pyridoxal phosphate-dependent aminotransferase [Sunxiuqinia elliptica]TDN96339.1 aspartate/methionine/tyrosine aminotransferase [Sunxiuqinia elliptica]TDO68050.1 aspartate/methionine/tyrosine aminotransferase [Sunxiuqinia elliptica]